MDLEQKMRVLWFSPTPSLVAISENGNPGGGWIHSLEQLVSNTKQIDLGIAFFNEIDKVIKTKINDNTYYQIPFEKRSIRRFVNRHLGKIDTSNDTKYLLEVVEDFKPDLIQIFGTEGSFGQLIPFIKTPCVIHIQGNYTVFSHKWFNSGLSNANVLFNSKFNTLLKANGLFHNYFHFLSMAQREQKILKAARFVMGRTNWDRRVTKILAGNAVYFHCDEVLRDEFYKTTWKAQPLDLPLQFLTTVQANVYKGLDTIIDTARLLKSHSAKPFVWKIAGLSPYDEMVKLWERKYKTKLEDLGIVLLGRVNSGELISQMLTSHLFIHPSHIDNSPNSVCEAMIIGMPLISTSSGGTGSLLDDEKEGVLVQDGDPYVLAGAIVSVFENYDKAVTYGLNAKERASKRHDRKTILNQLLSVYNHMLNN